MTVYDIAARLPSIEVLRGRCRALAMLDAIVGGDYYAYDREWGEDEAASMRNGSGQEYDVVFTDDGVFIRGIYHESSMFNYTDGRLWPGLLDGLPDEFQAHVHEPAFCGQDGTLEATFVLWRRADDDRWHAGNDIDFSPADNDEVNPDGSWLLGILCEDIVAKYIEHARDVYEVELGSAAVEHVAGLRALSDAVVLALNPEAQRADVRARAEEYGYPTGDLHE